MTKTLIATFALSLTACGLPGMPVDCPAVSMLDFRECTAATTEVWMAAPIRSWKCANGNEVALSTETHALYLVTATGFECTTSAACQEPSIQGRAWCHGAVAGAKLRGLSSKEW